MVWCSSTHSSIDPRQLCRPPSTNESTGQYLKKSKILYSKKLGQWWTKQNKSGSLFFLLVGVLKASDTAGWERRVRYAFSSGSSRTAFHVHHLGNVDLTTSGKVPLASPCLALPIGPAHKKAGLMLNFLPMHQTLQSEPKGLPIPPDPNCSSTPHLELNSRPLPSPHWVPIETLPTLTSLGSQSRLELGKPS